MDLATVGAKAIERIQRISYVLAEAKEHPLISISDVENMTKAAMQQIFMFVFTTNPQYLQEFINEQINNNGEFKDLLQTIINDRGETVGEYIIRILHD